MFKIKAKMATFLFSAYFGSHFGYHGKGKGQSNIRLIHLDNCNNLQIRRNWFCLFVFVALRPMSTAMVIAGRSVHLTTLFPGQA